MLRSMDSELKALLTALAEGQIKLAEGQTRLDERMAVMAKAMTNLGERMIDLGERMDGYARAVIRGFTSSVERDGKIELRVDAVEARLDRLEKRRSGGRKKK